MNDSKVSDAMPILMRLVESEQQQWQNFNRVDSHAVFIDPYFMFKIFRLLLIIIFEKYIRKIKQPSHNERYKTEEKYSVYYKIPIDKR